MAERAGHRPSDERIVEYLLGRLRGGERAAMDTRLFQDDAFQDAVRAAEDGLIDDYLAGEMSSADREAFEMHFASSTSRRERIAFARTLMTAPILPHAGEPAATPEDTASAAGRQRTAGWNPRAAWGGAAAAVLIGVVWLAGQRVARQPASPSPSPTRASTAPAAGNDAPPREAGPLRLRLRPEVLRGSGAWPRLDLPVSVPTVRLEADLEGPARGSYTASLRLLDQPTAWRAPAVVDTVRRTMYVDVPGHILRPGDYFVTFSLAGGNPASSAEYVFRARARP